MGTFEAVESSMVYVEADTLTAAVILISEGVKKYSLRDKRA